MSHGVNLPRSGLESRGVLPTKFCLYPIDTSQVIPFYKVHYQFSREKLLTPEEAVGGVLLTRSFFLRMSCSAYCRRKINMPSSLFCVNCLFSVSLVFFPSANNFRSNRGIWFKLQYMMHFDTTYDIPKFKVPQFSGNRETTSGIRVGDYLHRALVTA